MKTKDGKASSHFEHTIAVTEDGPVGPDGARGWDGAALRRLQSACKKA